MMLYGKYCDVVREVYWSRKFIALSVCAVDYHVVKISQTYFQYLQCVPEMSDKMIDKSLGYL